MLLLLLGNKFPEHEQRQLLGFEGKEGLGGLDKFVEL
jgi:hypothetical protein